MITQTHRRLAALHHAEVERSILQDYCIIIQKCPLAEDQGLVDIALCDLPEDLMRPSKENTPR